MDSNAANIHSPHGYPIGEGWAPDSEANAHLIAAAPDMLQACRDALQWFETRAPAVASGSIAEVALCGVRHQLRQAIAKAEGRA